jgi:tRNA(fMet)-specific endonuclease VapC
MTSRLLDTSVCISVIRGQPTAIERYVLAAAQGPLFISAITLHELWVGVARNPERPSERERLSRFLGQGVATLAFDAPDARAAADLKALLLRQGQMIGAYDLLIAAQASARGWPLATGNLREFARVPGLAIESWT